MALDLDKLPARHDAFFKELLSEPERARAFFKAFLPEELLEHMDLGSIQHVKKSFVDKGLKEHFSDMLFRVRASYGQAHIYILVEHKSHPEAMVALQLLRYMLRIYEHQAKEGRGLSPVIPMVFYHGEEAWRAPKRLRELFGDVPSSVEEHIPDYSFRFVDLSMVPDEELEVLRGIGASLVVMKHIWRPEELLERLRRLLSSPVRGDIIDRREVLMHYIAGSTPSEKEEVFWQIAEAIGGEAIVGSIAEKWFEEGLEKGREEGREEGRKLGLVEGIEKGREEGRREGREEGRSKALRALKLALKLRFGEAGERLGRRLDALESLDELDEAMEVIERASDASEIEEWLDKRS